MSVWNFDMSQENYDEGKPFLLMLPGNSIVDFLTVQVSKFEGRLYPDALDGCIDYDDAVTNAVAWAPCPTIPDALKGNPQ